MHWRILPHATACVASDKLFLLDLRQDRYFRVPVASQAEFAEWLDRRYACAPPPSVLEVLLRGGILREGDETPTNALKQRGDVPEPCASCPDWNRQDLQQARVGATVAAAWARLRLFSLHRLIVKRSECSPPRDCRPVAEILAAAEQFERSRNWTPIARNCLLDSLALDSWLARRGIVATLVFGIAAEPFQAHCWLQTRDALINDSYDHVSRFTPIFSA
ncbi:lasso peptide biosynthesis B2 protein [Sphingomonas canadensis]|uniref:Lasso peptide biosynthesis B2 protein n=1 Tax=Sphingomonas canadensis TaxID=1219257 RepID=A0ABW3H9P8_9SPHN|nr:lasso peptide biosynthesis B2 protein [Sphingomonas canadensis]MCW3837225.1 lasso peptide biosynthesis B2 protein [Sphingomonas canadensis]